MLYMQVMQAVVERAQQDLPDHRAHKVMQAQPDLPGLPARAVVLPAQQDLPVQQDLLAQELLAAH